MAKNFKETIEQLINETIPELEREMGEFKNTKWKKTEIMQNINYAHKTLSEQYEQAKAYVGQANDGMITLIAREKNVTKLMQKYEVVKTELSSIKEEVEEAERSFEAKREEDKTRKIELNELQGQLSFNQTKINERIADAFRNLKEVEVKREKIEENLESASVLLEQMEAESSKMEEAKAILKLAEDTVKATLPGFSGVMLKPDENMPLVRDDGSALENGDFFLKIGSQKLYRFDGIKWSKNSYSPTNAKTLEGYTSQELSENIYQALKDKVQLEVEAQIEIMQNLRPVVAPIGDTLHLQFSKNGNLNGTSTKTKTENGFILEVNAEFTFAGNQVEVAHSFVGEGNEFGMDGENISAAYISINAYTDEGDSIIITKKPLNQGRFLFGLERVNATGIMHLSYKMTVIES